MGTSSFAQLTASFSSRTIMPPTFSIAPLFVSRFQSQSHMYDAHSLHSIPRGAGGLLQLRTLKTKCVKGLVHGQKECVLFIYLQSGNVWYNYTWSKEEYVFVNFSSVRQFR